LFNNILLANKDIDIHLVEKVRAEEKSIMALENMLGYNIGKLEELRPHKKNLEFSDRTGYEEVPDLVNLGYWIGRIDNNNYLLLILFFYLPYLGSLTLFFFYV